MTRTIVLIIALFTLISASAQDLKKIKQLFQDAEGHLLYEEYDLALPYYLDAIEAGWENANAHFKVGYCYLNSQGQWKQAIPYFEKASTNVSANYREGNYKEEKAPEEAWFYLAKAYRLDNQFDKAIEAYKKYKSFLTVNDVYYLEFMDLQVKSCELARTMMQKPIQFEQTAAPFFEDGENYYPAVSGNQEAVAFTSYQEVRDDFGDKIFLELIFYSTKDGPTWKKPRDITDQIYSDGYFSTCHLSYNGDYLLLYRDDYGNGNIYFSQLEGRRWSELDKLGKNINTRSNETHASLSKDGSTLYFVSDRPGGYGETDIYYSVKDNKGRWGTPVNMGEVINTPFQEDTPFLSEDGQVLYFASEAHSSMGGFDIFKSTKGPDGSWSEPQNIGYPINTSGDDVFYLPIGDGTSAYMGRMPEDGGLKKIFKIEYKQAERVIEVVAQDPVITDNLVADNQEEQITQPVVETKTILVPTDYEITGKLTLQDNNEIDPSFYIHVAKSDGEVIAALSPDVNTGEFKTTLKAGSYKVKAFGEGYEPAEKNIFISKDQQNPDVLTFLEMVPKEVKSGEYFVIKSILFDYNSNTLNRESKIEIEKLYALMNQNPSLYVEVTGHTDDKGTEEYNSRLSMQRSRSVINYMKGKGIENSRFVAKGLGESQFIAINENPDGSDNPMGRKLNRRVDIKVVNSTNAQITTEGIYVPDELKYKDQLTYTILLIESEKVLEPSYFGQSGENINNVWMYPVAGGYIYTVGKFNHKSDGLAMMNLVVDAGFPDASIINSLEYSALVQESSSFYKAKMNEKDDAVYTIQLYALKKPVENKSFKGLNKVNELKGDDGYYRYVYGEYVGKISARQALKKVMANGYMDAFIVEKANL